MKFIYYLTLTGFLFGCTFQDENAIRIVNNNKVQVDTEVLIDNRDENDKAKITGVEIVSHATGDHNGNVYVVNPAGRNINAISESGELKWSSGGGGNEPGQFSYISAVAYNDNKIFAFDIFGGHITTFNSENGEFIERWPVEVSGQRVDQVRFFDDRSMVAVTQWNKEKSTMVELYDSTFSKINYSMVDVEAILQTDNTVFELQMLSNFLGSVIPVRKKVLYVPFFYKGEIRVYEKNGEKEWRSNRSINGYQKIDTALYLFEHPESKFERSHYSRKGKGDAFNHAEFRSVSLGLYEAQGSNIVHMSYRLQKSGKWNLIVEYFDKETLNFKEYYEIVNVLNTFKVTAFPLWYGYDDSIYLVENSKTPLKKISLISK